MIAAIDVLLPEPVTPVTRIIPRSASAIFFSTSGTANRSKFGTSNGITRITIMKLDRCRRMFTRNRPMPGAPHEQS